MPSEPRRVLLFCAAGVILVAGVALAALRPFASPAEEPETRVVDYTQAETDKPLVVYVSGAIRRPGVYEVPRGARLYDVVKAAGGELPFAAISEVNLSDVVTDQMKIHVPLAPDKAAAAASGLINVNTADAKTLESLPGIGQVTAGRIIEYREEHGFFRTKDELTKVKSISRNKLAKFEDKITL